MKIRGHRVELGEIEAMLREHPEVADCAVLLEGEGDGVHAAVMSESMTPCADGEVGELWIGGAGVARG